MHRLKMTVLLLVLLGVASCRQPAQLASPPASVRPDGAHAVAGDTDAFDFSAESPARWATWSGSFVVAPSADEAAGAEICAKSQEAASVLALGERLYANADVSALVRVKPTGLDRIVGIGLRGTDARAYLAMVESYGGFVRIWRMEPERLVKLAEGRAEVPNDKLINLRFVAIGNALDAWVDGLAVADAIDDRYERGLPVL